jgi:ferrous iron transport protein A
MNNLELNTRPSDPEQMQTASDLCPEKGPKGCSCPLSLRGSELVIECKRTLANLAAGQGGRILALTGQSDVRRRLTSLGITPGSFVTHLRTAPLGDPIQVSLGSFEVCLRKDLASLILIEGA